MTLRKVASLDDLWSGELLGLDVDGNGILVVNVDDRIYAYDDACPHQKSRLSEGDLTGRIVRCARHHWEFDVCTGRGMNPQNACLKAIPVTLESGDILLDLDEGHSTDTAADSENQP
jgi:toluene monooxygenase system ferredoxin subunit